MPEGPEVRSMATQLAHEIEGTYLHSFDILGGQFRKETRRPSHLKSFQQSLPLQVLHVSSYGKHVWIYFETSWTAHITFGMSGTFRTEPYLHHNHLRLIGSKEKYDDMNAMGIYTIYYNDIRRFGTWNFYPDMMTAIKQRETLGIDLFQEPPPTFSELIQPWFYREKWMKGTIADALMTQEIYAGFGAYLVAETLYRHAIHPCSLVYRLFIHDNTLLTKLYWTGRQLAKLSYEYGGASLHTFRTISGKRGNFQDILQVYGKTRDPYGYEVHKVRIKQGRRIQYVPVMQPICDVL